MEEKEEGGRSAFADYQKTRRKAELTLLTSVRLENDSFSECRSEELMMLFGVVRVNSEGKEGKKEELDELLEVAKGQRRGRKKV